MWTNPTHFTLLVLSIICGVHTVSFQPQTTYEHAGVLDGVLQPGCTATSGFYSSGGYYSISTVGEFLEWSLPVTFTGDFIIKSEVLLETIDFTAATFIFINTNSGLEHFGFDGDNGVGARYFLEGASFSLRYGAPSPPANVYVDVEIVRTSNIMQFRVDGDLIFSEYYDKSISVIGYRPHRNTIRVRSLYTQAIPTDNPTHFPTTSPTRSPTSLPTKSPTSSPTSIPTLLPTRAPTSLPTAHPTSLPTKSPTSSPTPLPTLLPTVSPTSSPTSIPTLLPTISPTSSPTLFPTSLPTISPTSSPTLFPTSLPTISPTSSPTLFPTSLPTISPTSSPTVHPTLLPTESEPTIAPTSLCRYVSYALVNSTSGESIFVHYSLDDIGRVRYYTLPVATWKLAITNVDISGNGSVLLYQQDPSRNDCYGWQHSWTQLVELDGAKLGNFKFWSINYEMDAIDGVAFEDEVAKSILYYSLGAKVMNSPDILVAYPYRDKWVPEISGNVALIIF